MPPQEPPRRDCTGYPARPMSTSYKDNAYGQHLPAFLRLLLRDARVTGKQDANNPTQTGRRNFARQMFAFVDGSVESLRTLVLVAVGSRLPLVDIAGLYGSYALKQNGRMKRTNKHEPAGPRLLLSSRLLVSHLGLSVVIETGRAEWKAFTEAQDLRNRITHPRLPCDLVVNDKEFGQLEACLSWLERHVGTAFAEAARATQRGNIAEEVIQAMVLEP
jgi:hypothetical protein